jgi:hypothetical protein
MAVKLELVNIPEGRVRPVEDYSCIPSKAVAYNYIQATYDTLRGHPAGTDQDEEIAVYRNGYWTTPDGEQWTDFIVSMY